MSLNVMVVDDEHLARSRIKTLLADCPEPPCLLEAEASDAMEAMAKLRSASVDVVLLDIHMPGADGLQLARELRRIRPELAIIFVTAHAEHAVDAFDLDVTDYLTKPVRAERLQKALQKALLKKEQFAQISSRPSADLAQKFIIIQDRGRTERIPLPDVLYFKAELKYVTVRTAQRSYILDGSLADLETQYGEDFLRIHRNTLVARREMRALERFHGVDDDDPQGGSVEGWAVRLRACDDALQVSRRQLASVRAVIAQA
ncbi:LytTR family DNA-binding domain-containing protein [Variovorax sp. PCZ-1]|uniref:LytR/AlgR family response regulator transcription factor n=1 Tax=Variovorax sp. PCZ-1 TaxID=2835533 RepID=UPI001BD17728|nr:LytTR family DNA-binding domain-containing protein [Variovorax sp. PCZ-1]MBS7808619.1 response regulator transcription factor [Variovorax sp. PCZ-1]